MKILPILFIFDMDNTIIGNSINLINYKNFVEDINYNKYWKNYLKENFLIRPYLKTFLKEVKELYPTAEFFIYSVGTRNYVNYIIETLEEELEIKFNRPLATREDASISKDTNEYIKELNGQQSKIFETLEKKYGKFDENTREIILKERTIIIDDNPRVWNGDIRHIICKPYNYIPIIELDYNLMMRIYENKDIYMKAKNYISDLIPNKDKLTFDEFMYNYHLNIVEQYSKIKEINRNEYKDDFFKKLLNKMKLRKRAKVLFTKSFFNLNKYTHK